MLRKLFSRWFGDKSPEITSPTQELDLSEVPDEALFYPGKDIASGPHIHGIARDYADQMKACQIRNCERPSAFDVITLQHLDVDLPFARHGSRLEDTDPPLDLPTYQFYAICDRHYEKFVRGKAPNGESTKLVIGPAVVYKVDDEGKKVA